MPRNPSYYRYEPDHNGINQLARSSEMGNAMEKVAFEGAMWAIANVPRKSNALANSITVDQMGVQAGLFGEFRSGAMIIADAPHAFASEVLFKGGHRTLRNAARMLQRKYGSRESKMRGGM